ncbi:LacI family DNA-binding transcriptional regulator [Arthrobacter sp. W4I7]|uniref:LacI family DNA-binding transcriptional regulator n=1 Tax=Arthrobacter sp. W4I7 TaxID=3042296 RepID=UPI00277E7BBC|nr:LacI family DNA-binding transcriptional regulator [Arthrobacter sp. W4I7]MDQ0691254.1 hypothetical protein [Arthrobacter sp. W4I7]
MSSGRNEVVLSADSSPSGRELPNPAAKMRDVAMAAGVSRATVSNFLNKPHVVAATTRFRIERAIREVNFQPDEYARQPRARRRPNWKKLEGQLSYNEGTCQQEGAPEGRVIPGQEKIRLPVDVRPGEHVTVQVGPEVLSGLVDAVMPDNSYFWVRADNGMGRRLIDASTVTTIDLTGG